MLWFNHPAYVPIRDGTIARFRRRYYIFKTIRKTVFLCGGAGSPRREAIKSFLAKHHPTKLVFFAEDVWNYLATSATRGNALQLEEELAALADIIVLIVESPGTMAELGAFSIQSGLRAKMLPIVDRKWRAEASFINTGPLQWISQDSQFAPPIHVSLDTVLDCAVELEERLSRLPSRETEFAKNIEKSKRHLLYLLCDLVAVIGPAPIANVMEYLSRIRPAVDRTDAEWSLGLAHAMGLIRKTPYNGIDFVRRPLFDSRLESFQHQKMFDLDEARARHLSILLKLPGAAEVLAEVGK